MVETGSQGAYTGTKKQNWGGEEKKELPVTGSPGFAGKGFCGAGKSREFMTSQLFHLPSHSN